MMASEKLAALEFAASNGVIFVEDADRPLTTDVDESGDVQPDPSRSVTLDVVHAMDGLVSVEIREGSEEPDQLVKHFDGLLTVEYGRLRVRDVAGDNLVTIGVTPGPTRLRIYLEAVNTRRLVLILLQPL